MGIETTQVSDRSAEDGKIDILQVTFVCLDTAYIQYADCSYLNLFIHSIVQFTSLLNLILSHVHLGCRKVSEQVFI